MLQFLKKIFSKNRSSQEDEYPSSVQMLEEAAYIFLNKKMYISATGVFTTLVTENPRSSMGWYGIANALYCLAAGDMKMNKLSWMNRITLGYQCILRSIEEDQDNKYAKELCHWMVTKSPLRDEDVSELQPFHDALKLIRKVAGFNANTLIENFQQHASMMRMKIIMCFEGIEEQYVGDLFVSALSDPDKDVKMAALKRIGMWGNREEVRSTLEEMVASEAWDELGPYPSMGIWAVQARYPEYKDWSAPLLEKIRSAEEKDENDTMAS
ncbi:MAG: hypothetical protein WGN25_07945 [Candidatus Electrothrix sp. GW3-4]|uniref:hypothetical protein n=1 Tax=Candidatus Electrothrix sp. GW3-4 TaxID=3126740 RepID=UPI0030D26620